MQPQFSTLFVVGLVISPGCDSDLETVFSSDSIICSTCHKGFPGGAVKSFPLVISNFRRIITKFAFLVEGTCGEGIGSRHFHSWSRNLE